MIYYMRLAISAKLMPQQPSSKSFFAVLPTRYMFYKSSILAAILVLISMGNAIAAELSNIETSIAEQQSELLVNAPNLKRATTKNSASIAKARLLNIKTTAHTIPNPIASHTPEAIAATNVINDDSKSPELTDIPAISDDFAAQRKIADTSSELNAIKQWEINKSVTLTDVLLNPSPVSTIAQAPEKLPDNSIPSAVTDTAQPAVVPSEPGSPKPSLQILEAQKPKPQNNEPKKWAVGVHTQFSTTGLIGVDAGYKFSPNFHARLGINTVGFNVDYTSQGIDYKAKFNPTNVHLLGDFFPFGGGLRLTGGLVFQNNQFNATGTPNSSAVPGGIPTQISLGGINYNINDVGLVSSEGSFSNSIAPYLGIGFGTPISPGLGFNLDAGVMFAGSANVKMRANIPSSVPAALQSQIRTSLIEQERKTNNDIGGFNVYPVISVGVSYAF